MSTKGRGLGKLGEGSSIFSDFHKSAGQCRCLLTASLPYSDVSLGIHLVSYLLLIQFHLYLSHTLPFSPLTISFYSAYFLWCISPPALLSISFLFFPESTLFFLTQVGIYCGISYFQSHQPSPRTLPL